MGNHQGGVTRKANWRIGTIGLFVACTVAGCAPTNAEIRAGNMWDLNYMSKLEPPLSPAPVEPKRRTDVVPHRAGEVAIWQHPSDPQLSLIIGADESRRGGLMVFDLQGNLRQQIRGIRLPYGVSVRPGFDLSGTVRDIVVTAERDRGRLRVFAVDAEARTLNEVTGNTKLFESEKGEDAGAMGVALHRNAEGRVYAIVPRKRNDDGNGILFVYELLANAGRVDTRFVRHTGSFSQRNFVRTLVVDDHYGTVFFVDRAAGIQKYSILDGEAPTPLASFAREGWQQFCNGLAIWPEKKPGEGMILAADRQRDFTTLFAFRREGEMINPHSHGALPQKMTLTTRRVGGIAIHPQPMPGFPEGILVASNQHLNTFDFYSWRDLRTQRPRIQRTSPRRGGNESSSISSASSSGSRSTAEPARN